MFSKNKDGANGLYSMCNPCNNVRSSVYQKNNPDKKINWRRKNRKRLKEKQAEYYKEQSDFPKYVKKPSKWYFNRVKMVAKKRKILFNLNMKEFVDAYHGRCNLSGIPLTLVKMYAQSINQTASLDRIDSSQGYEKSNIQWVHKKINIMKNNLPEKEFFKFCNKIIENQN